MLETYVQPVTPEVVTPIKPSEAIRLGCLLAPIQIADRLTAPGGRACALGAMLGGYGMFPPEGMAAVPTNALAFLESVVGLRFAACPACGRFQRLGHLAAITHLNDDHLWRRERIADWLEGQGL